MGEVTFNRRIVVTTCGTCSAQCLGRGNPEHASWCSRKAGSTNSPREYTPLAACDHSSQSVRYVKADDGSGTAECFICDACHNIEIHCEHSNNEWNEEGTVLLCQFCGQDGT